MTGATGLRRLTLVRHGHAEDKGPGERDFDRPLDPRGVAEVTEMARRCRDGGLLPERLLASAALRTVQTAQAFQRGLAPPAPLLQVEPSLYLAEAGVLLEQIRETDEAVAHLMVIAHNPGLGDLAAQLAPGARFAGFETGATFTVAFPAGSWRDLRVAQAQDFRYDAPGRFFAAST